MIGQSVFNFQVYLCFQLYYKFEFYIFLIYTCIFIVTVTSCILHLFIESTKPIFGVVPISLHEFSNNAINVYYDKENHWSYTRT